ncbi:MAG TPA: ornithine cyclodeaminase family protein [Gemmatimonadaceae bacterium]|nr:ornithine cyclodeaminase family protein [Gemmatimonadaceae bacterium]
MLILDAREIERLLDMSSCVEAVEAAFRARGSGASVPSAVCGVPLERGKLHVKVATLDLGHRYAVAKVNANLPDNPRRLGLPAIQGVVLLFDAATGSPLAALESGTITSMRTAAASAVAARWLALTEASSVSLIGCGTQARAHVAALRCVRTIEQLHAFDADRKAAETFCAEMTQRHGIRCQLADDVHTAASASHIVVTSTPSHHPLIDSGDVSAGAFVAAVGADNEDKQEIGVELMRTGVVVVDDLDQCARMGDLHHAIASGAMSAADVHASLDQVVANPALGRIDNQQVIIFDSTGVAIEDVAAAAVVYERAIESGAGTRLEVGSPPPTAFSGRSSS